MSIWFVDCIAALPRRPAFACGATRGRRRAIGVPRSRSRGFSFTEILFAVIVLGIGFIMVAAIFPVAIQQSKLTSEEGTAAGVAREALSYLGQVGANSDAIANAQGGPLFPATGIGGAAAPYLGQVYSFRDPQPGGSNILDNFYNTNLTNAGVTGVSANDALWDRLNLSLIVPSDPRYAYVGLYRRNGDPGKRATWSPYVQAWFIPVTARSRSVYSAGTPTTPGVDINGTSNPQVNLQARLVKVSIVLDPSGGQGYSTSSNLAYVLYNFTSKTVVPANYNPSALTENCYVIIANDNSKGTTLDGVANPDIGRMNGRIYHLGLRRPDLDGTDSTNGAFVAYDLAPNGGFTPDIGADGLFGNNPNYQAGASQTPPVTLTQDDDVQAIGNTGPVGSSQIVANGPADAYVVGTDTSGADPGSAQEISAFTTFIKVN